MKPTAAQTLLTITAAALVGATGYAANQGHTAAAGTFACFAFWVSALAMSEDI